LGNLKNNSHQEPEFSIYDPACAIYSPQIIEAWIDDIAMQPKINDEQVESFVKLIPIYHPNQNSKRKNLKEFRLRNLLSYSFFFGLGVTIFDKEHARRLLYGLNEGWSRTVLFWLDEVRNSDQKNNNKIWNHAINILTVYAGTVWPDAVGLDANEDLIKNNAPIAGFTPAIRLGLSDPDFAVELFEGAEDERRSCNDDELLERIDRKKKFISNSYNQKETCTNN
jgi:hypothetical protein